MPETQQWFVKRIVNAWKISGTGSLSTWEVSAQALIDGALIQSHQLMKVFL